MSSIRFGRGRDYQIFRREEVRARWNLESATHFLNRFRGDAVAMGSFRRQLQRAGSGSPGVNQSDEEVVEVLARMLVSGALIVALPHREDYVDVRAPEAAPAQAAPAPREKALVEETEDEPTFVRGHDGAAQAAVLIAAAKAGIPFCEECQRQAALQTASQ